MQAGEGADQGGVDLIDLHEAVADEVLGVDAMHRALQADCPAFRLVDSRSAQITRLAGWLLIIGVCAGVKASSCCSHAAISAGLRPGGLAGSGICIFCWTTRSTGIFHDRAVVERDAGKAEEQAEQGAPQTEVKMSFAQP